MEGGKLEMANCYDTYSLWINHYGLEDKSKPLLDDYAKKLDDVLTKAISSEPSNQEKDNK